MKELTAEQREYIRVQATFLEFMYMTLDQEEQKEPNLLRWCVLGYMKEALKWLRKEDLYAHEFAMVRDAVSGAASVLKLYNISRTHTPIAVIQDMKVYEIKEHELP